MADFHDQELITRLLIDLIEWGPYIHAENIHSVYIHFESLPKDMTHKLRVSDHEERAKYGYKWQLRLDGIPAKSEQKQWSMYFDDPAKLVKAFTTYYNRVENSEEITNGNTINQWP